MQKLTSNQSNNLLDIFELFFCSISFFYTQANKGTRQRQYEINSYTGQFLYQSRVEFKINLVLCSQFEYKTSLCFTDQETQKEIFWWNQLPCGPVLTPISCTKLKIHSPHAESPIVPKHFFFILHWQFGYAISLRFTDQETQKEILCGTSSLVGQFLHPSPVQSSRPIPRVKTVQLFLNNFFFLLCWQFGMWDQSMLHRSRNSGRDFWWNQLPCWPVLTPISCTKLMIHSVMKTVLVLKQVLSFHLFCGTKSMLHRSRNSRRDFWWNQLPRGPVLTPISCTKFKTHSTYEDSPIVPKQFFFTLVLAIWNVGPVNASQIKKLRKRFLVEPAPLWASSYTHLLCKVQDPICIWRQSNCS